ncbi:zinc finger SWIM domain-containing protein 3 [Elysia marginata]|uniref:Zinc finger SWIM domain-containing protein 3 n=1 Tax=Elysia marginata TaxID=1093978 RepID=A0AAV4FWY6_9GAST|nr:zinc finger SWIM domain-containing protein 3 [Elysia marginata]
MAAVDCEFSIGSVFSSYHEFETKFKEFQTKNHVLFIKGVSETLKFHPASDCLKYKVLVFRCKQGKKRPTTSTGARPKQRTLKCGCQAHLRLRAVDEGGSWVLKVTGSNMEHTNHPVDALTASVYPENRQADVTDTIKAMVGSNVPKKSLKRYIEDSQGIVLLPQDVNNLKRKLCGVQLDDPECVERMLQNIREEGGVTKVGVNESGEFEFLFFMTASMRRDLEKYCDVLVMDATYKVNCYLYPLVNVLCVDSEGSGRPVLHGFVRKECCASLMSCLTFLKSVFSVDMSGPSVFFVDKDLSEIAAVRETFPEALVKLCSFHASTAVKRALTSHGLSSQQVDDILKYFKEQRDTRSVERFLELSDIIRQEAPDKTVQYFQTNWWDRTDMWAAHTTLDLQTFHLTTTNHVESYHSKIKQTLHAQTRLGDCIQLLMTYDFDLVRTKDINSHLHSISHHYNTIQKDPELESIVNTLTSFGVVTPTETTVTPTETTTGTETACFSFTNVKLQKVKTRGRPRNKQNFTKRTKRRKIDKTTDQTTSSTNTVTAGASVNVIDESMCYECGKEEVERQYCVDGVFEWIMCDGCGRWFHKYCIGMEAVVKEAEFLCKFCVSRLITSVSGCDFVVE